MLLIPSYGPPYDFGITMMKDDLRVPDCKVGSLWLGRAACVPDDGKLGSRAEVLPHLRQGKMLVVYSMAIRFCDGRSRVATRLQNF
jgi:hypothetical protein